MDESTEKLLRSLSKLFEKPEIRALEASLVKTLGDLIEANAIAFYEVRELRRVASEEPEMYLIPVGFDDIAEEADEPPRLLNSDPLFLESFASRQPVSGELTAGGVTGRRYVYPVIGMNEITGFLALECKAHVDRDHELIGILLGFYRNYFLLVSDNQRDHLTQLLNRKCFDEKIMKIVLALDPTKRRAADRVNYCLAVLDIDHFKRVNDTYGHLLGDEVLLHFAQCMMRTFREYDLLFRVGGEEFVAVLRNVDADTASAALERFRREVETHYFPQAGQITTSIGFTFIGPGDLPVTVMDRADQALYYAKEHGRNQTASYENLLDKGELKLKTSESSCELF